VHHAAAVWHDDYSPLMETLRLNIYLRIFKIFYVYIITINMSAWCTMYIVDIGNPSWVGEIREIVKRRGGCTLQNPSSSARGGTPYRWRLPLTTYLLTRSRLAVECLDCGGNVCSENCYKMWYSYESSLR